MSFCLSLGEDNQDGGLPLMLQENNHDELLVVLVGELKQTLTGNYVQVSTAFPRVNEVRQPSLTAVEDKGEDSAVQLLVRLHGAIVSDAQFIRFSLVLSKMTMLRSLAISVGEYNEISAAGAIEFSLALKQLVNLNCVTLEFKQRWERPSLIIESLQSLAVLKHLSLNFHEDNNELIDSLNTSFFRISSTLLTLRLFVCEGQQNYYPQMKQQERLSEPLPPQPLHFLSLKNIHQLQHLQVIDIDIISLDVFAESSLDLSQSISSMHFLQLLTVTSRHSDCNLIGVVKLIEEASRSRSLDTLIINCTAETFTEDIVDNESQVQPQQDSSLKEFSLKLVSTSSEGQTCLKKVMRTMNNCLPTTLQCLNVYLDGAQLETSSTALFAESIQRLSSLKKIRLYLSKLSCSSAFDMKGLWTALGFLNQLESLAIDLKDGEILFARSTQTLITSLEAMKKLRSLELKVPEHSQNLQQQFRIHILLAMSNLPSIETVHVKIGFIEKKTPQRQKLVKISRLTSLKW